MRFELLQPFYTVGLIAQLASYSSFLFWSRCFILLIYILYVSLWYFVIWSSCISPYTTMCLSFHKFWNSTTPFRMTYQNSQRFLNLYCSMTNFSGMVVTAKLVYTNHEEKRLLKKIENEQTQSKLKEKLGKTWKNSHCQ